MLKSILFKEHSLPQFVNFFVTNRCNLTCKHCFYSSELNKPVAELSLEEIRKMSSTMGTFPIMNFSGGEPFLRKDIADIAGTFYRQNHIKYLSTPTNGSLTKATVESVERIASECSNLSIGVNFSVDGLEKEHAEMRESATSFGKVFETFGRLKELRGKYKNLKLGFITTYAQTNQNIIEDLYDFLKSQDPDNININLIRGNPKDPSQKDIDYERYKRITQKIEKDLLSHKMRGYGSFRALMAVHRVQTAKKIFENGYLSECYASRLSCVLQPNGDVVTCELHYPDKIIGNIRDFDFNFPRLWNSQRNKEFARWVKDSRCFCTQECQITCNTIFNPSHLVRIGAKAFSRSLSLKD